MSWRKVLAPVLVLAALLLAFAYRWETEASRTVGNIQQIKYVRDRWTGRLWERRYASGSFSETATTGGYGFLPDTDNPQKQRSQFAVVWGCLTLLSALLVMRTTHPDGYASTLRTITETLRKPGLRVVVWTVVSAIGVITAVLMWQEAHRSGDVAGYSRGFEDGRRAGTDEGYQRGLAAGVAQERAEAEARAARAHEGYAAAKAKYDECVKAQEPRSASFTKLRLALICGEAPKPSN